MSNQEEPKRGIIYGLCDPISKELRYVGLTTQTLKKRLMQHCAPSSRKVGQYFTHWIRSLRRKGLKPDAFVIEEVPIPELAEAERDWIAYFRYIGCRLINVSGGGETLEGRHKQAILEGRKRAWKETGELTRARIANANRVHGKSERNLAHLARVSEANRGSTISEQHKKTISLYNKGKTVSNETRKRLSEAKIGKCSDAQRKHLEEWNKKQKGKPHTGVHKQNHRLAVSKLNMDKANEIRILLKEGQLTMTEIGRLYGVSSGTISAIKAGRTWKN